MQRLAQPAGRAVKLKFGKSVVSPRGWHRTSMAIIRVRLEAL